MSNRLHSNLGDSHPFPSFFVCLQGTYHPKMCSFLPVWRFQLFFCPLMNPAVCTMRAFLPSGLMPPSLLMPNYLPALIVVPLAEIGNVGGRWGAHLSELPSLRLQCQCRPWSATAQQPQRKGQI